MLIGGAAATATPASDSDSDSGGDGEWIVERAPLWCDVLLPLQLRAGVLRATAVLLEAATATATANENAYRAVRLLARLR